MKATQCDRCKKYFTEEIPDIMYRPKKNTYDEAYKIDVCPKCLEAFKDFIKKGV